MAVGIHFRMDPTPAGVGRLSEPGTPSRESTLPWTHGKRRPSDHKIVLGLCYENPQLPVGPNYKQLAGTHYGGCDLFDRAGISRSLNNRVMAVFDLHPSSPISSAFIIVLHFSICACQAAAESFTLLRPVPS